MKRIFTTIVMLMALVSLSYSQNNTYLLVKHDCFTINVGIGHLFNCKIGDYDFNQDYVSYNFGIGKYITERTGVSLQFSYDNSTNREAETRLYTIGAEVNNRLTNYYAYSPVDVILNIGLSYGRFDYKDDMIDSEGMDYIVPKVSLDIVFNLTSDKAYQLAIEPSYQYFAATKDKYYYDDGSKVKGNISLLGILGKLMINF